jgi:hypothetical protein
MGTHVKNYLFAKPSVVGGFASVIDLGATLQEYNYSKNIAEADGKAILNDWLAVGDDIRFSINKYDKERATK